jgi:hypothetical protein
MKWQQDNWWPHAKPVINDATGSTSLLLGALVAPLAVLIGLSALSPAT